MAASPEAVAEAGLTVVDDVGFGWTLVEAPASDVADLAARTGFAVEPNHVYELVDEPLFPDQWSWRTRAKLVARSMRRRVLDAWSWTTGASDVVVAILDTGVALTLPISHPTCGKPWRGCWQWPRRRQQRLHRRRPRWDAIDNDANPSDTDGHGTFVATTAVAALNDAAGWSGSELDSHGDPVVTTAVVRCPPSLPGSPMSWPTGQT